MQANIKRPLVLIVGAGFGGINAAQGLAGKGVDILLIDRTNHHVFQPLLYQTATAALAPSDIASPIRTILRHNSHATVIMGEVSPPSRRSTRPASLRRESASRAPTYSGVPAANISACPGTEQSGRTLTAPLGAASAPSQEAAGRLAGVDPDLRSGHADEARITPLRAHKAFGKKALIRYCRNTAMALSHTFSAVKPYSRITTSPGAEAPNRSTASTSPPSPT